MQQPSGNRGTLARYLIVLAGACLGLGFLLVLVDQVDLGALKRVLADLRLEWALSGMLGLLAVQFFRALRWQILAEQPSSAVPAFVSAAITGNLVNTMVPFRAGEVWRIIYLQRRIGLSWSNAIASSAMDRFLDVVGLGVVVLLLAVIHSTGALGSAALAVGYIGILIALLGSAAIWLFGERILGLARRGQMARPAALRRAATLVENFVAASLALRRPRVAIPATVLTSLCYIADFLVAQVYMTSLSIDLPWHAGITVAVFIIIAGLIPGVPAGIGVFQGACVAALSLYGIEFSQALAFGIVAHAAYLIVNSIPGLAILSLPLLGITALAHDRSEAPGHHGGTE